MSDRKSTENGVHSPVPVDEYEMQEGMNNSKEEHKVKVTIETEIDTEDWIPDGGWGWGVVAGAVIAHVYIGK